jgi:hypothetical protein
MSINYAPYTKALVEIGQLQILRKLITNQIFLSARVESSLYQSCLETLNYTVLHNLDEIRETAKRTFVDREDDLAGMGNDTLNQTRIMNPQQTALKVEREKEADKKVKEMLKDMTTCLENVGFVNPMNKVYKLVKDLDFFPLAAAIHTLNALD